MLWLLESEIVYMFRFEKKAKLFFALLTYAHRILYKIYIRGAYKKGDSYGRRD